MILVALTIAAAAPQSSDAPPRTPTPGALASALTSFTHHGVGVGDVRRIQCEGLYYDPQNDPRTPPPYACEWDQRIANRWVIYSTWFHFLKDGRWKVMQKPDTDLPADPTSAEEQIFRKWLIPHLREEEMGDDPESHELTIRYGYAFVDLNDDGRDEALVWTMSDYGCGSGGCDLEIEVQSKGGWRTLSDAIRTRPPIEILPTKRNGWHYIGVFDSGGGILPGFESAVRFTGKQYEDTPTDKPLPKRLRGRVVLTYKMVDRPLF